MLLYILYVCLWSLWCWWVFTKLVQCRMWFICGFVAVSVFVDTRRFLCISVIWDMGDWVFKIFRNLKMHCALWCVAIFICAIVDFACVLISQSNLLMVVLNHFVFLFAVLLMNFCSSVFFVIYLLLVHYWIFIGCFICSSVLECSLFACVSVYEFVFGRGRGYAGTYGI